MLLRVTMAASNKEKGTITLIFQAVGKSTMLLSQHEVGESIADIAGPLGRPTEVEGRKKVCVVGGGTGNALAYPVAAGFKAAGAEVDMVSGFKTKELIVLQDEFEALVDNYYLCTDDGTAGEKAFTTDKLKALIEAHGGKMLSGVSSKTNYLVAGANMGPAKLEKAQKLGVTIISEEQITEMIENGEHN